MGKKKTQGIVVILTSMSGKIMEQEILLQTMLRHTEKNDMIGDSQRGFTKAKKCLKNVLVFCSREELLLPSTWTYAKHMILNQRHILISKLQIHDSDG